MRQPDVPKKPSLYGWLWWLALMIAGTGALVCYLLRLDTMNPDVQQQVMMTAALTGVGTGICIIAATAHWWMHR